MTLRRPNPSNSGTASLLMGISMLSDPSPRSRAVRDVDTPPRRYDDPLKRLIEPPSLRVVVTSPAGKNDRASNRRHVQRANIGKIARLITRHEEDIAWIHRIRRIGQGIACSYSGGVSGQIERARCESARIAVIVIAGKRQLPSRKGAVNRQSKMFRLAGPTALQRGISAYQRPKTGYLCRLSNMETMPAVISVARPILAMLASGPSPPRRLAWRPTDR